jgi:hypothetical protein
MKLLGGGLDKLEVILDEATFNEVLWLTWTNSPTWA